MACNFMICNSHGSSTFDSSKRSFTAINSVSAPSRSLPVTSPPPSSPPCTITWERALKPSQSTLLIDESSRLDVFIERIKACNRGKEKISEFIPFVVEGEIVGYTHREFADEYLRKFKDVFVLAKDSSLGPHVSLHPWLQTNEDRTEAVGYAVRRMGDLITGVRNELYPVVVALGKPSHFSLERAAAPYFGTKTYGTIVNGYIENDEEKLMWLSRRSETKATYPGMLDPLAGGGMPPNVTCKENLMKECKEEAGVPKSISKAAIPVGASPFMDIEGYRLKRDVIFCYDLKVPENFVPYNEDGEVDSFKLLSMNQVQDILYRTESFRPCVTSFIIDFLVRHGYVSPDEPSYLSLLQILREGDFS